MALPIAIGAVVAALISVLWWLLRAFMIAQLISGIADALRAVDPARIAAWLRDVLAPLAESVRAEIAARMAEFSGFVLGLLDATQAQIEAGMAELRGRAESAEGAVLGLVDSAEAQAGRAIGAARESVLGVVQPAVSKLGVIADQIEAGDVSAVAQLRAQTERLAGVTSAPFDSAESQLAAAVAPIRAAVSGVAVGPIDEAAESVSSRVAGLRGEVESGLENLASAVDAQVAGFTDRIDVSAAAEFWADVLEEMDGKLGALADAASQVGLEDVGVDVGPDDAEEQREVDRRAERLRKRYPKKEPRIRDPHQWKLDDIYRLLVDYFDRRDRLALLQVLLEADTRIKGRTLNDLLKGKKV